MVGPAAHVLQGDVLVRRGIIPLLVLAACSPAWADRILNADVYQDMLRGMWLGQLVGNYGGRQVEGLKTVTFEGPIAVNKPITSYQVQWNTILRGHWYDGSGILSGNSDKWLGDDDTCLEFLYAHALQTKPSLTVAGRTGLWTSNVALSGIYIANKQAWLQINTYGRTAEQSGSPQYNMYAGWAIDSQITTEALGAIAPGMRGVGSALANDFGGITNSGYPLHAAQYYAAMYAEAPFTTNVETLVAKGLQAVPQGSWTHSLIAKAVELYEADKNNGATDDWLNSRNAAIAFAEQRGRSTSFVQSAANTALTTLAILYGQGDFVSTVEYGVRGGRDSDCNPATAGGLVGLMKGYAGIVAELDLKGYDTSGIPESYYSSSMITGLGKSEWAMGEVVTILQTAAETQIVNALGLEAITGTGAAREYRLPDSGTGPDVLSPAACVDPTAARGVVGEVRQLGGTVTVVVKRNGDVQTNNSTIDRGDQDRLIDGVYDLSNNGVLPFYTYTGDAGPRTDTYELHFGREVRFDRVTLHEGDIMCSNVNGDPQSPSYVPIGGYFTDLTVEVLRSGLWVPVLNPTVTSPLDPFVYFQSIDITFTPIIGEAIRVVGSAGGQKPFTSLTELEVFGIVPEPTSLSLFAIAGLAFCRRPTRRRRTREQSKPAAFA